MLNMKRSLFLAAVGLAALLVAALAFLRMEMTPGGADRANPEDSGQVELGEVVYGGSCSGCHGDRLQGQPDWRVRKPDGKLPAPPHDQTGHTWHHPDEHLFRVTKLGVKPPLAPEGYESDMPGFGDTLTDDEIWAVLSFIKSTWPPKQRAYQQRVDEAYRRQAGKR
ncbi:MAG: c-type cytochrome [Kiloniellaceae bacterium]